MITMYDISNHDLYKFNLLLTTYFKGSYGYKYLKTDVDKVLLFKIRESEDFKC